MGSEQTPALKRYGTATLFEEAIVKEAQAGYRLHSWHAVSEMMRSYERVGEIVLAPEVGATVFYALFIPLPPEVAPVKPQPLAAR